MNESNRNKLLVAQIELIKAVHRKDMIDREAAQIAGLKPLLSADIEAAWDAPSNSRSPVYY